MGLKTKIEYVTSTHNFWYGCTKVSEGCVNCFAKRIYERFYGKDFSIPIKSKNFDAPLKWKKPRVILVNDMSDFFHEKVNDRWRLKAFDIFFKNPLHQYLLLTKRPKEAVKFFKKYSDLTCLFVKGYSISMLNNIYLGVSVENQRTADERIPELLEIPYFKKWLSIEPILSSMYLNLPEPTAKSRIHWVVCGGETGQGARIVSRRCFEGIICQCELAQIPFFMKQMPNREPIPNNLMIRQYPNDISEIMSSL